MAETFAIVGLILSIIGTILVVGELWEYVDVRLPKTRLKELEEILAETGFLLQGGLEDGFLYRPSFLHRIEERLLRYVL